MKAIVFDLDGTLVDSAPDIVGAGNALLADEGAAPIPFAVARSFIGAGADVFVRRMMAAAGLPDEPALHARLSADYLARYEGAVGQTTLYPGAAQALASLAANGWRIGLCTNKPLGPTRAVIGHFGIAHHFASIIAGDTLAVRKPDPAPLRAAIAALAASEAVFVGDSEVDAQTAAAAGVPLLIFSGGYRKAALDAIIHAAAFDHHAALPALASAHALRLG
jgi:phosphoglycolate phosphatase